MEAGRRRVGGKMRRMKKISDMMPEETRSSKRQKARRGWVGGAEKRCDEAHSPLSLRERQPQTCRSGADQTLIRTT